MAVQVKVSTQAKDGQGNPVDLGTVVLRLQQKVIVPVFQDGKMVNSEQWQDKELKTLANEEGTVPLHANQRVIIEEAQ